MTLQRPHRQDQEHAQGDGLPATAGLHGPLQRHREAGGGVVVYQSCSVSDSSCHLHVSSVCALHKTQPLINLIAIKRRCEGVPSLTAWCSWWAPVLRVSAQNRTSTRTCCTRWETHGMTCRCVYVCVCICVDVSVSGSSVSEVRVARTLVCFQ